MTPQDEERIAAYLCSETETDINQNGAEDAASDAAKRILHYAKLDPQTAVEALLERAEAFENEHYQAEQCFRVTVTAKLPLDQLHADDIDSEVPGVYCLNVGVQGRDELQDVKEGLIERGELGADAREARVLEEMARDYFHSTVAIKVLDNYTIEFDAVGEGACQDGHWI